MQYEVKKAENCFSDSQTYEYRLPIKNQQLIHLLTDYEVHINDKFRRPLFNAENNNGVRVKGILREPILKVSYPEDTWEQEKGKFEQWLSELKEEHQND